MAMAWLNTLLLLLLAGCGSSLSTTTYRPVVMMHGMMMDAKSVQKNVDALEAKYPGIYVKALAVFEGRSSMTTSEATQLAAVIEAVQRDGNLSQGFDFYGESQGALLARAFVTESNHPPVHNLVAINGPQAGVGECPHVELSVFKPLCGILAVTLDIYQWPDCAFCDFWKGKDKETYLKKSEFLADVNNDRAINETRRNNMLSLNKYMATVALQDTMVQPPQSAWHSFWYWGDRWRSKVMPLNETEGYTNDTLGLKTLNERGSLILNSFDGDHLGYTMDWWNENVLPMFGSSLNPARDALIV